MYNKDEVLSFQMIPHMCRSLFCNLLIFTITLMMQFWTHRWGPRAGPELKWLKLCMQAFIILNDKAVADPHQAQQWQFLKSLTLIKSITSVVLSFIFFNLEFSD